MKGLTKGPVHGSSQGRHGGYQSRRRQVEGILDTSCQIQVNTKRVHGHQGIHEVRGSLPKETRESPFV